MILDKKINYFIFFLFFALIGFLLRYINNYDQMYWLDEAYTLFLSNPSLPFNLLENKIYEIDDNPKLYFYLLRILNYISYTPENIRFSSIIFGTLSLISTFYLYKNFLTKEENFYAFLLLTFNIFLIWQSKESRISSSILFFSIINFIIFFEYLKSNKKNYSVVILIANLFLLSYYPFLIVIIITQIIFVILNYKKKYLEFFSITILTFILYFLLNYDYIISNISKTNHIGNFEVKFFINFFFRSFFGSIFLGGISLFIFCYCFIKLFFTGKKNDLFNFNLLLIFITYLFVIFYSYFKAGIMVPRYFIFIIPSIILIITKVIYPYKILRYFYILATIINTIIMFDEFKIKKPKVSYLMKNLDTSLNKNFYTEENKMLNTYFIKSKLISKNLKFIDRKKLNEVNSFIFICLNYPEMHYGKNNNLTEDPKCNKNFKNFYKLSTKNIKDFKITMFKKN